MRPSRSRSGLGAALATAALCAAGGASPARAQSASPGIEGGAFLLVPIGARGVALGQAATADGGTSEAIFWNPAGLASLAKGEFAIYHYDAFFGSGDAIAIAAPSSRLGTFALAAYLVNYGDLAVTRGDLGPEPVGQISPRNLALMATLRHRGGRPVGGRHLQAGAVPGGLHAATAARCPRRPVPPRRWTWASSTPSAAGGPWWSA